MKKIFPNTILGTLLTLLILLLFVLLALPIENILFSKEEPYKKLLFEGIFSYTFTSLLIIVYNLRKHNSFPNISIQNSKIFFISSLVILSFIFGFLGPLNNYLNARFFENNNDVINPYSANVFALIMPLLIAPILEEVLFRGIILKGLISSNSKYFSLFYSTLLFTIIHHSTQYASAFFLGIVFGIVYVIGNNLLWSILLHILANNAIMFNQYLNFENIHIEVYFRFIFIALIIFIFFIKKHGINNLNHFQQRT